MLTGKLPCELVEFLDMASFELTPNSPAEISNEARDFLKSCFAPRPRERLTAEKLLLHRFVAQPQALEANDHHTQVVKQQKGMLKKGIISSTFGYPDGFLVKPRADYHTRSTTVPRMNPHPAGRVLVGLLL
ncbi:mitogen-activated protein kinase kinase kinase 2-like [Pyrus ussuriensis x Pyrus communis]|uniref:Mitogen-activated protein kinase kinase kinase 2-like n=1 Tax=Pyrus ussuriensis x Pyrus communis TaxID=2448454 RepID=A0A5N5G7Y0_9ROSA|nr:mitogen-activated protein kinase kinase kinase 2-like [Pyrus ussuriensis x Pyrus communis]